jgi:Carboxypeptidase regulatory-like domain
MRYGNIDLVDGRLHVDSGSAASTLEIVVATGSGQLDGRVLDAAGKPAPNATVVLVPDASRRSRVDFYKVTTMGPGGRFHFANIPGGDYAVFAWEDIETGAWLDPQVLRLDEARGVRVHVAEGASLTADLSVIPAR